MRRGEIWLAIWPTDPQKEPRPVLIVSNNIRNAQPHILDIVVCKLTSLERLDKSQKPVNPVEDVVVSLKKKSIIRGGGIFSIPKSILQKKLSTLLPIEVTEINKRLKTVMALD